MTLYQDAGNVDVGAYTRKPLIILNASANSGRAAAVRSAVKEILGTLNSDAEVVETRTLEEADRAIKDAAQQRRGPIIACGGDGTVRSAASSLLNAGAPVPFGIVPAGTANDYAFNTLHLPSDLRAALEVALHGQPRRVDVARMNDGWLINAFGAGLDGNVAWDVKEMVETNKPWARGSARYTVSILRQIVLYYHRLPFLDMTIDGKHLGQRQMLLFAVMIGPTTGGGFKVAPDADPTDGKMDVLLMRRMPAPKALVVMPIAKAGKHTRMREVRMLRSREVKIRGARTIQAHADGDPVRAPGFDISVVPGGLTVMCP